MAFCNTYHLSEQELTYYAIKRANEGPLSVRDGIFVECDLYAIEPNDLFQESEDQEGVVYVFTKLKKKTQHGTRIDRRVGGKGTWKERDKSKTLYDQKNQIIGWSRGYAYSPNFPKSMVKFDHYRMKEYSLHSSVLSHAKFKDYVLCKIKKYSNKKKRNKCLDSISPPEQPTSATPLSINENIQTLAIVESDNHQAVVKDLSSMKSLPSPPLMVDSQPFKPTLIDLQASDAPLIIPSPLIEIQPEPAAAAADDDDDDDSLDWITHFAEELKQFQTEPLEDMNQDGELLPNPMALWYLEDMIFKY